MERGDRSVLVVAGEASGELYGSLLVQRLGERVPGLSFFGLGGDRMARSGVDLIDHIRDTSMVGLLEVVGGLPRIRRVFKRLVAEVKKRRPVAAVLIDYPDFNLILARSLRRLGIKVAYYIGPTVWAWRAGRLKTIAATVDAMLVIFPFEESIYRDQGIPVRYVGHPLTAIARADASRDAYLKRHGLADAAAVVGLLPGSRASEIRFHMPAVIEAARIIGRDHPGTRFALALADTVPRALVERFTEPLGSAITVVEHDTYNTMKHADALVVSSGTATMEAALLGTPFVSIYRVSSLSYRLGRRFVKVNDFCIVNLVLGETVVSELIQDALTAKAIAHEVESLLEDPERRKTLAEAFGRLRALLGGGDGSAAAAEAVAELIAGGEDRQ